MTTETTDPRPLLFAAADQAVGLIGTLRPEQLGGPTPCPEYDVRTLAGHVISVLRRATAVAEGGNALDVPAVTEADGAGLAEGAVAARARLGAVWADDGVLDRVLTLPFGTMPGRAAGFAYAQEFTTHAWDLAAAVGQLDRLDPGLAAAVLPLVRQFVPAESRGGRVPFGPVVPVPDDVGAYQQLAGWLGRDPSWRPSLATGSDAGARR
jgi:uncharacterized protein (TIGR03086 family)